MALKKNEEGPNKDYWEFIERMAREEREQRPHWALAPSGSVSDEPAGEKDSSCSASLSRAQNVLVMEPR